MRRARSTVALVAFVLLLSVFVANFDNVIDANSPDREIGSDGNAPSPWTEPRKYEIGDSADRLMWFLQISDLHLSSFNDPSRISELKEFCNSTVSTFAPHAVVASGDLTDGKAKDGIQSGEQLPEWKYYKQVLDDSQVTKKTIWLDMRGNHDNFNVPNVNSTNNYFTDYSIQGRKNPRSYMRQISVGTERYTFLVIDACLQPGPKFPFNFVGALDAAEIARIQRLVEQSRRNESDYILWFGHYPTSCIVAQCDGGVKNLMGRYSESMAYMCGHYHTLGGLVPNMYALQEAGYLELELGDWRKGRAYRLGAMDHGQFSFVDLKHREWPVVLITNPKHALYAMPQRENSQSVVESTHVRVLTFSPVPIKFVKVQIDDGSWQNCHHVKGPLYALKWNPTAYVSGIHHIRARVVDNDDREKEIEQPFVLDGTKMSFGAVPKFILTSHAITLFQAFFFTILAIVVVPLCMLRLIHILCERNRMKRPRLRTPVCGCCIRKLWILSTVDSLFFPLVLYALYLAVGPWSVGEIIDNHTGVMFAWGVFIGNSYLPGCASYLYGFVHLFSFHLPLTVILAHVVDRRLRAIEKPQTPRPTKFRVFWRHLPFVLLVAMQSAMVYYLWRGLGTLAAILCPIKTWSLFLAGFLWYRAHSMPDACLRPAARIWSSSERLASQDPDDIQGTRF